MHRKCISVQCVPQGSHLTTLPIYFYLFPVLLVNAVLQPTKWRKRREGERKKGGGGCNEMHCWEGAGRRSHDPCDVDRILMSHKVPLQKRYEGAKYTEEWGRETHTHTHTQHTQVYAHRCTCADTCRTLTFQTFFKLTIRGSGETFIREKDSLWAAVTMTGTWM